MFDGYQLIIAEWCGVALTFGFFLIRLYVNYAGIGQRKCVWYRDLFVFTAWALWCAWAACESIENDHNMWSPNPNIIETMTKEEIEYTLKVDWIAVFVGNQMVYFCKLDLLFLFHELAPRSHHPRIFWFIILGWVLVIAGWLVLVLYMLLSCMPVSYNWNLEILSTHPELCKGGSNVDYYYSCWLTHFFSDLILLMIPCVIIYRMQKMSLVQKLSAAAMFIVGFINVLTVLAVMILYVLTVSVYTKPEDMYTSWALGAAGLFVTNVQKATTIFVVCMPQLKPFYRMVRDKIRGVDARKDSVGTVTFTKREIASPLSPVSPTSPPLEMKDVRVTTKAVGTFPALNEVDEAYDAGSRMERGSPDRL